MEFQFCPVAGTFYKVQRDSRMGKPRNVLYYGRMKESAVERGQSLEPSGLS